MPGERWHDRAKGDFNEKEPVSNQGMRAKSRPSLQDILDVLESLAPSDIAEDWDNPGLQVGILSQEISKIFVALDPTLHAVDRTLKRNAQVLLTHHPLIFKPLSRLNLEGYPGNVILKACQRGISIVAVHTNLDAVKGGVNDLLANLLGLQNVAVLQERDDLLSSNAGLGRIGDLPRPIKLSALVGIVKGVLKADSLKVLGSTGKTIRKVAVVGGSGGSLVSMASEKGADILITGDISHHEVLFAESIGLALIDGGHFHTERTVLPLFTGIFEKALRDHGWQVSVEVDHEEKNPMRHE